MMLEYKGAYKHTYVIKEYWELIWLNLMKDKDTDYFSDNGNLVLYRGVATVCALWTSLTKK